MRHAVCTLLILAVLPGCCMCHEPQQKTQRQLGSMPASGPAYGVTWRGEPQGDHRGHWTVVLENRRIEVDFILSGGPAQVARNLESAWREGGDDRVRVSSDGPTVFFHAVEGELLVFFVREDEQAHECQLAENEECQLSQSNMTVRLSTYSIIGVLWEGVSATNDDDILWTVAYPGGSQSAVGTIQTGDSAQAAAQKTEARWSSGSVKVFRPAEKPELLCFYRLGSAPLCVLVKGQDDPGCHLVGSVVCTFSRSRLQVRLY